MLNRKIWTSCTWLARSHFRRLCSNSFKVERKQEFELEYLTDPANMTKLKNNIMKRKETCSLDRIVQLHDKLKTETDPTEKEKLSELLSEEVGKVPNSTHPDVKLNSSEPSIIKSVNTIKFDFLPKDFGVLAENLGLLRIAALSSLTGPRSYFLMGDFAELEHALVRYSIAKLLRRNFKLVSVPDILPSDVINGCGMNIKGERSQIYGLEDYSDLYLSGTSELGLAYLKANTIIDVNDLPICFVAVSRCYRKEVSTVKELLSLYRLHNFTKVEMFGISHPDKSEELFHSFVVIQDEIFTSLGLEYRIVDMPICDLGPSAYRKFDIQVWFPGSGILGELSSCSNCTDYQAHRLNIRFQDAEKLRLVHTVNGTACAIPRTIMAIIESHQLENGDVKIPEPLREYFNGREKIEKIVLNDLESSNERIV